MTVRAVHTFQSAVSDGADASLVQPSDWNADHSIKLVGPGIVARTTASDGDASEFELTQLIDSFIGSTQGMTLYRNASQWVALAAGTAGHFLSTGGSGANPSWTNTSTVTFIVHVTGGASALDIRGDAGQPRSVNFKTSTTMRWSLRMNNTSEGGSNTGSDIELKAYNDAGTFLFDVFSGVRSTGVLTLHATPIHPTPSQGDNSTKSATTAYVDAAVAAVSPIGKHMVPVMAGAIAPSVSGGCAVLATVASAANQPDIVTLDFDATTQEYAQFTIPMPESWNEGTITFQPIWSHASTTTNFGVVWDLQAVAVSNDDTIAVAFGSAQTSTDTGGTTNDVYIGPESSAITVAGSPAAGDLVCFRISRVTGNGSDTMAIDARLHGIRLYFTTAASTDA